MSINFIHVVLYNLVHFTCTVIECIVYLLGITVDFYHGVYYGKHNNDVLLQKLKCLGKPPTHLTVLLGHEEPSYKDLANIVFYCISTGIPYLSFYDYKGVLKKHQNELEYHVNEMKSKKDHIIWHNNSSSVHKNGFIGRKIHLKVFSQEDGQSSIVSLCKNIASEKIETNFSIDSINEHLKNHYEFPDPELGLYCGEVFSLYDYPQWQVRVTEFLSVKSHHNLTFELFIDKLLRFGKCEQRLGK
ncbi:unnamed protein product [Brassicogethes aeneus]|uniref:ditrans,polycis-polyprenyl diphosphate synthase [(2E,6E)-farnesyldiphosphate specific] n=1 Tax=Brassicogethes aeneus TaxID=1431903 RepID=A0A9P0B492_BRAAE|nr:unnamed protein product [Brassicogethes aeneus]